MRIKFHSRDAREKASWAGALLIPKENGEEKKRYLEYPPRETVLRNFIYIGIFISSSSGGSVNLYCPARPAAFCRAFVCEKIVRLARTPASSLEPNVLVEYANNAALPEERWPAHDNN